MPNDSLTSLPSSNVDSCWLVNHYFERGRHENELTNHRLTWLLASQTLLFAGYGVILTASIPVPMKASLAKVAVALGTLSSLLLWLGILASLMASVRLWKEACSRIDGELQPLGISWWTTWLGWSPAMLLPILFIWSWLCISQIGFSAGPGAKRVSSQRRQEGSLSLPSSGSPVLKPPMAARQAWPSPRSR